MSGDLVWGAVAVLIGLAGLLTVAFVLGRAYETGVRRRQAQAFLDRCRGKSLDEIEAIISVEYPMAEPVDRVDVIDEGVRAAQDRSYGI